MKRWTRRCLPPVEQAVVDLLAGRCAGLPAPLFEKEANLHHAVDICRAHGVHHLVAGLVRKDGAALPDSLGRLLTELEADRDQRYAALLAADAQLRRLADVLDARGIPFCLLKGLALVHTLYQGAALQRLFGDIDILVPERYFDGTRDAFFQMGYRLGPHQKDIEALRRYGHKLCFHSAGSGRCSVDVHFRPLGKKLFERTARLDTDLFWSHAASCSIAGKQFMIPGPELHLIYLCVHLSLQHHLASLNWLYDLRRFSVAVPEFDWDLFVRMAKTCRVERSVWLSLQGATDILDARIPPPVMRQLHLPDLGRLTTYWYASRLDALNVVARVHHYKQPRLLGKMSRMFSEVLLIDRRRDRWAAAARWAVPGPSFCRASYRVQSTAGLFLCYVLHPLVIAVMAAAVVMLTVQYAWDHHENRADPGRPRKA